MRQGAAAKAARKQRAEARLKAQPSARTAAAAKYRTPTSPTDALAFATELGWEWSKVRDGFRLTHPSGATACIHMSVSDQAAWRNLRSVLLRPVREAARNDV